MPRPNPVHTIDQSPLIADAIARIHEEFGDVVSVSVKKKALLKFGRVDTVATADGLVTVWNLATSAQLKNETYATTNAIDGISSSSTSDTAITASIEYHTVSGTGADAQYTFGVQTKALNGQNKATLDVPCARVSRIRLSAAPVGAIYVYSGTPSSGVPNPIANAHAKVNATETQSYKAATTFSNEDYFILTQAYFGVSRTTNSVAQFIIEVAQPGDAFHPVFECTANQSGLPIPIEPHVVIPKNSDVRVVGQVGANNTGMRAWFNGHLAKVI